MRRPRRPAPKMPPVRHATRCRPIVGYPVILASGCGPRRPPAGRADPPRTADWCRCRHRSRAPSCADAPKGSGVELGEVGAGRFLPPPAPRDGYRSAAGRTSHLGSPADSRIRVQNYHSAMSSSRWVRSYSARTAPVPVHAARGIARSAHLPHRITGSVFSGTEPSRTSGVELADGDITYGLSFTLAGRIDPFPGERLLSSRGSREESGVGQSRQAPLIDLREPEALTLGLSWTSIVAMRRPGDCPLWRLYPHAFRLRFLKRAGSGAALKRDYGRRSPSSGPLRNLPKRTLRTIMRHLRHSLCSTSDGAVIGVR